MKRLDPADTAKKLSNSRFNNATFDNVTVKKYFEETDGIRYPEGPIINIYTEKMYPIHYGDLKSLYKVKVGEQTLSPNIKYDKRTTYYPTQLIDFGIQLDYVPPEKKRLFEEYDEDSTHSHLYCMLYLKKQRALKWFLTEIKKEQLNFLEWIQKVL